MQNEQLADPVDVVKELRQKGFERGFVLISAEHLRTNVSCSDLRGRTHHTKLTEISGQSSLRYVPATLLEQSAQVLLARDSVAIEELENSLLPLSLFHSGFVDHGAER